MRRFGRAGAKAFLVPIVSVSAFTGGQCQLSTANVRGIEVLSAPAACAWGLLSMQTVAAEVRAWRLHGMTLSSIRVRGNEVRIVQTTRVLQPLMPAAHTETGDCAICEKTMQLWQQPNARMVLLGTSDKQSVLSMLR